ncbi:hypothetical protein [Hugenholtzia roseola]|uniref:hypothetical protein n=1 Tax=Hugenholtzia roseola TaxID=1002 RepID=UPI00047E9EB4|nr:hypothetical protein [Hugenholtzia roseola]
MKHYQQAYLFFPFLKKIRGAYFRLPIALLFLAILSSCWKRSNCPTYADSDPKVLFGQETFADQMKKTEAQFQRKSDKKMKSEGKSARKKSKSAKKKQHKQQGK